MSVCESPFPIGPVTRLAVAVHDFILLSAGADGALCVWNVNDRDRAPLEQSVVEYTAEVLVDRTHLMERQSQLIELERQVEDVTNQMDFQQRRFEAQHKDAMNQLEVRFNKELAAERYADKITMFRTTCHGNFLLTLNLRQRQAW